MANNALDEILNMEERTDQTAMPEDTSSLDDIINFEDQAGETSTDVPTNQTQLQNTMMSKGMDMMMKMMPTTSYSYTGTI